MDKGQQYLGKSESELKLILGQSVFTGLGGKPLSDSDKTKAANAWLSENLVKLRSALCGNAAIQAYLRSPSAKDLAVICGTIFDLLNHQFHGLSTDGVGALSAMLTNYELTKLCTQA